MFRQNCVDRALALQGEYPMGFEGLQLDEALENRRIALSPWMCARRRGTSSKGPISGDGTLYGYNL
jgi:hypothetical protein